MATFKELFGNAASCHALMSHFSSSRTVYYLLFIKYPYYVLKK
ncbi:hypothetical protein DBV15_09881 [Temnothorax longispinosus]|uniref:Uncharacterized protein n=1 Tax=Temnothorax longispinosus TaxID=300112 RepID=A0A4S2KAG9_9HYME|nr:hypothetical protein DBV15_09881 [Temnothorax longispinosus]